jgi:hypothetical protein
MINTGRVNIPAATGTTQVVVDPRDRYGNDIPRGRARVKLKVTAGKLGTVHNLPNGNYTATLNRNNATDQKVVVTGSINGKHIKDNAVVFFK